MRCRRKINITDNSDFLGRGPEHNLLGVPFRGEPGEEVFFTLAPIEGHPGFRMRATFEAAGAGTQFNLETGRRRRLRLVAHEVGDLAVSELADLPGPKGPAPLPNGSTCPRATSSCHAAA